MSHLQPDVEAEYVLLAGLMFDNRRIDAVADILAPEHFSSPFYGDLYGLILSQHGQGQPANIITLRPLISTHPSYPAMGGDRALAEMTNSGALMLPHVSTARQIVARAKRRELVAGLEQCILTAGDLNNALELVIDEADRAIVTATYDPQSAIELTGGDCLKRLIQTFDEPKKGALSTVIPSIDKLLGPLRPKQLVILAARPGMGKTATALSYALGAAQGGYGTLYVSLEMSGQELAGRMAGDLSFNGSTGIPLDDILADDPSPTTRRAVAEASVMLEDLPLSVIDTGKLTIGRLAMIVRRHKRRMAAKGHSLDLVVIDYLQLLSTDERNRSAYETVSEISRALKAIAKDNDVAVLALAQLSREVEKRPDKRPQLSDLRDSGQIEQDADAVLFLIRDEYYLRQSEPAQDDPDRFTWEEALAEAQNKLDFICAKRRNGSIGTAQGNFYTRFQAVRG